jgi:hypothetical protein
MVIGCKLSKDDEYSEENKKSYRSMIGIILYMTASRQEIMKVVGNGYMVSRCTEINSCERRENNIEISKHNLGFQLGVLKR